MKSQPLKQRKLPGWSGYLKTVQPECHLLAKGGMALRHLRCVGYSNQRITIKKIHRERLPDLTLSMSSSQLNNQNVEH
jgi:hypothetical protein